MNKYKVQFTQTEVFEIDVLANNEEEARELANNKFNNKEYYQLPDTPEIEITEVFDVTNTNEPFNP